MSVIRSRKHSRATQPLLNQSLIALAVASLPMSIAHAQAAQGEKTLGEVKVSAAAESYKAEKASNPKLTQPLVDTTQTITVIKKEVLQEQGAVSLMDALRNTPGITLQLGENGNTSAGDTFQMRGFSAQTSIFQDGVRDLAGVNRDVFNVEQIEISKGPTGADSGRGSAAGNINLGSKQANLENSISGTAAYNSAKNKRATADLNRRIGENSAIRINAMAEDGGQIGRESIKKEKQGLALAAAFGLGTATRLSVFTQHLRQDGMPDGGTPTVGISGFYNANAAVMAAPKVDRNSYYGLASDYEKMDSDMATVRIEHDLGAKTVVSNTTRIGKSKTDRILTGINGITATSGSGATLVNLPQSAWTVSRSRQSVLQENEILANLTNVVSEFNTGSVTHTISAGLELSTEEQFAPARTGLGTVASANLYAPNRNDALTAYAPILTGAFSKGQTSTVAGYIFDTIKLNDKWQINGGVRYEHYDVESTAGAISTTAPTTGALIATRLSKSDTLTSWKAGVLYKPAENGSIYAAIATSQTPPGSANFSLSSAANSTSGVNVDPQKTTNIELGTKWDVIAKQLALTAAVYRTDNKNELFVLDAVTNTYGQTGKRRVEGFELGAVGQITSAWNVIAGVQKMKATIIQGTTGGSAAGVGTRWSPDWTATLWSTYKLQDTLTFGGGLRYSSEQQRSINPTDVIATTNMPEVPAYTVVDAMASYRLNKNVSLQLNVYNLFDKFYISTLNNGGARVILGQERAVQLTANVAF